MVALVTTEAEAKPAPKKRAAPKKAAAAAPDQVSIEVRTLTRTLPAGDNGKTLVTTGEISVWVVRGAEHRALMFDARLTPPGRAIVEARVKELQVVLDCEVNREFADL